MFKGIKKELFYQYRSMRLLWGFVRKRYIHCNLQVTYRCNFKCQICDFWKTKHYEKDELTLEQFRVIAKKLKTLGTLIISMAGGEPLAREDLSGIIRVFNEEGHFPVLITNGWYVDKTRAHELLEAGLQEISVSVDYADSKKHDAQRRQEGSWDKAIEALELLNKTRTDRRNRVHMISVLMDDNLDDIEPLIKIAREHGVTYMVNLYSYNRGAKPQRLPDGQVAAHLLELKKHYPEFISLTSYIESFDDAIKQGGIGNCQTGKLMLNIDPKGSVARCTETLDKPVGNILTDNIRQITRNLKELQKNSECAQCWVSCRGFAECMQKPPRTRQIREFYTSVKRH